MELGETPEREGVAGKNDKKKKKKEKSVYVCVRWGMFAPCPRATTLIYMPAEERKLEPIDKAMGHSEMKRDDTHTSKANNSAALQF